MTDAMGIGIGIDFGTVNSCVSLFVNNKQIIVLDELGNNVIPTSILFLENEILFGETANIMGPQYPKNWIKDIKRIIGKSTLKEIEYYNKQHLYEIIEEDATLKIIITYPNQSIKVSIDEITGLFFGYLKKQINKYLDLSDNNVEQIYNAIITIPAYFTENQRLATIKAAQFANIKVLRLINEPTAAALTYLQENDKVINNSNLIIFDIGGGTLDVTLLNLHNNKISRIENRICFEGDSLDQPVEELETDQLIQVIGTEGDSNLGGNDFDKELMLYFFKEIKKTNPNLDLQNIVQNNRAIHKVMMAVKLAKIELSNVVSTSIIVEELLGVDYNVKISRSTFEALCNKYFNKCTTLIESLLINCNIKIEQINDIILIGGPSCMPKLSTIIEEKFGIMPKKLKDPKYSVCVGASLYCHKLVNNNKGERKQQNELLIIDVTPLKIGVGINDTMCTIINKNTKIPCSATKVFSTEINNQRVVSIKVYQGNSDFIKYNELIGKLRLSNIPAMLKKLPKILVKFSMDCSGTLTVVAKELVSGLHVSAVFDNKKYNVLKFDNLETNNDILNLKIYQSKSKINDYITTMSKYLIDSTYSSCVNKESIETLTSLLDGLKLKMAEKVTDEDSIKKLEDIYEEYKESINKVINN